jgi:CHAD domain-containing protein
MNRMIIVPVKEANLLRSQTRRLVTHRRDFLEGMDPEALHDLRVASRRMREVLEYLQPSLPFKTQSNLLNLGRRITKSLGKAREAEVSLGILEHLTKEQKLNPVASEILLNRQSRHVESVLRKAQKRISSKKFSQYEKFLDQLRGSFSINTGDSPILLSRREAFLGFNWEGEMDDLRLHDLRVRAKKFRYSLEIYDRLRDHKLGRLLRRMKMLQDVLGNIHDLYVFGELIREEQQKWETPRLTVIPLALQKASEIAALEKSRLYPRVFPLYSKVVNALPPQLAIFNGVSLVHSA